MNLTGLGSFGAQQIMTVEGIRCSVSTARIIEVEMDLGKAKWERGMVMPLHYLPGQFPGKNSSDLYL
jgi:hypothetical protein